MDLRGVAYAETTTTTTTTTREDEREASGGRGVETSGARVRAGDGGVRAAARARGCARFSSSRRARSTGGVEGYAPKPGRAPAKRARASERRRVRVVVHGDARDDRDDDERRREFDDDLVWYQADAAVRAASSSMI